MKLSKITLHLLLSIGFIFYNCSEDNTNDNLLPIVSTAEITGITQISALCGGIIISDAGATIIERGVCWSTNQTPDIIDDKTIDGSGAGSFTSTLIGLKPDSTYYVRAYATNIHGTGYGSTMSLTTYSYGSVSDVEGNYYKTLNLGNQEWMIENLKVTRYRNSEAITILMDNTLWSNAISGAYCNYDNLGSNGDQYGRLYNWFAITDSRNVCPQGWHIPSKAEITLLQNNFSDEQLSQIEFFENGGGNRQLDGSFVVFGEGYFWTVDKCEDANPASGNWAWGFWNDELKTEFSGGKNHGFSIRCVKD